MTGRIPQGPYAAAAGFSQQDVWGLLLIPGKNEGPGSENKAVADFLVTFDLETSGSLIFTCFFQADLIQVPPAERKDGLNPVSNGFMPSFLLFPGIKIKNAGTNQILQPVLF